MSDTDIVPIPSKIFQMGLSTYEISLYGVYTWTTRGGRECYKSLDTLAREGGMSRPSVMKARDSLLARGMIKIEIKKEYTVTKQYVTLLNLPETDR